MELLLKIPKDKPPFIGVVFPRVRDACEFNQELVNDYHDRDLFILFGSTPSHKGVSFFISSDSLSGKRWYYKDVLFDKDRFENFLYMTRGSLKYTFAHVLRDFDQEIIVDTAKFKKFIIRDVSLYVAGSDNYDPGMRGKY